MLSSEAQQLFIYTYVGILLHVSALQSLFAGISSVYMSWMMSFFKATDVHGSGPGSSSGTTGTAAEGRQRRGIMTAAFASCCVMRSASLQAFQAMGRGMVAGDIIPLLTGAADRVL